MNIKKLFKSERGTHTEMRTVRRSGKTFKRKTRVGTKEITYIPTKIYKEFIITNKSLIDIEVNEIKKLAKDIKDEKNKNKFFKEEMRDLKIKLTDIWSKSKKDKIKEIPTQHLKKSEIVDVMKLMRGTGKTKVPVHRESGVKLEYRRTGKKESPRKGTGKMDRFPESIKKEILDQRSYGESGAKIKGIVENLIDTMSTNDQMKMETLGLIDDKNKLTLTAQALTDWAKKQGIESTKKRTSAVEAEKVKHEDTKKDLDRADKKIAELKVKATHNLEEIKIVQQSKQESDRIRQELGKDNRDLKSKLKACLGSK